MLGDVGKPVVANNKTVAKTGLDHGSILPPGKIERNVRALLELVILR